MFISPVDSRCAGRSGVGNFYFGEHWGRKEVQISAADQILCCIEVLPPE